MTLAPPPEFSGTDRDVDTAAPPHRPDRLDPADLGFTPREPVKWLSPAQLAATGARVALSAQFGAYLDKRELQVALPTRVHDHATDTDTDTDELWLDYVADVGDGFDATYTMAYLLAQQGLEVAGEVTPRGHVLVIGGDLVYPTASTERYEDRFEGPYTAALPDAITQDSPHMYAVAGNHDWYDGLTAFLRLFARRAESNIGGWRTQQTRSYFALKLPHGWWMLAIDAQGDAYLDDPQLEFFKGVAATFHKGDKVIVTIHQPSWVLAAAHPRAYDTLDYFLQQVIEPSGAEVAFLLAGDLHHYARYTSDQTPRQLIHCGGGGAFTHATHHLPEEITVPPRHSTLRRSGRQHLYELAATYPTRLRSQWLGSGVFGRLPWRNPGFTVLLGMIQTMLLLALQSGSGRILTTFLMTMLVLVSCMFFAVGLSEGQQRATAFVLGGAHGLAQLALGVGGWLLWTQLPVRDLPWLWQALIASIGYLPVAGIAGVLLVCAYLLVAARFGVNVQELFAGQGIEDFKCFLRMRFAPDGSLTLYVIGVDKVGKRWVAQPTGSWFRPRRPLRPRLVDEPVTFGAPKSAATSSEFNQRTDDEPGRQAAR
ncbi:metallophosphoesterase family protein [Micromonospora sp. SL1-18]|uniref:metallophosphoesterase family protein n=1 Tax=Micromonospora sp. SL1-18 TaxID=3399128 RepID=UPI003A4E160D